MFPPSSKTMSLLGPPLVLSQFTGLFPFELPSFRTSRILGAISAALAATMIVGLVANLTGPNVFSYDALMLTALRTLTAYPSFTGVILLGMSFTVKRSVSAAIGLLLIVEHRFARRKRNFPKFFFKREISLRTVGVGVQMYLNYKFIANQPIQQYLIRVVGIFLTHFLQNVCELQFLAFVDVATRWYALCRKRLTLKTAEQLVECHKDLSKACRALEGAYAYQNCVSFIDNFVICTVNLFYTRATAVNWTDPLVMQLIVRTLMKFYEMFLTCMMVTEMYDQAKGFDEALYTLMLEDETKFLLSNEKVMAHLSRKNEVIFTGGRVFTIHSTAMNSIANLVVNYLVILIQFGGTEHVARKN